MIGAVMYIGGVAIYVHGAVMCIDGSRLVMQCLMLMDPDCF